MGESPFPMRKKRLMGLLAVLSFGLTALFAVLGLELLVAPTFVLGFFILLPLVGILGDDLPVVANEDEAEADAATTTDPVEQLRERYARGEIDEAEFERKLERLLETEDLERTVSERERSVELE